MKWDNSLIATVKQVAGMEQVVGGKKDIKAWLIDLARSRVLPW